VSAELGEPPGAVETSNSLVGYSVRLDSHIGPKTKLAYVTYGIALKMFENGGAAGQPGTAFDEVTHVIIDEGSTV
jgi:ATP-dependent RNA helicase DHX29